MPSVQIVILAAAVAAGYGLQQGFIAAARAVLAGGARGDQAVGFLANIPLFLFTLVKSAAKGGPKEAKIDMEGSGLAPVTDARIESYVSAQPTSCNMKRP